MSSERASRGNALDFDLLIRPQRHDRAFAKLLFDLLQGAFEAGIAIEHVGEDAAPLWSFPSLCHPGERQCLFLCPSWAFYDSTFRR